MVEVYRRDNESTESLVRRFMRRVQQSGVLLQARKVQFFTRKKSKRKVREAAMRRAKLQAERERLVKLGELDEYSTFPPRRQSRVWKR